MGRRVLRCGGCRTAVQQGFTLIEVMTAMAITITVMLANLYLFDIARKNMSQSRALTAATNLATEKIAAFKSMTLAQLRAAAPLAQVPCPMNSAPRCINPLDRRQGSDTVTRDGIPFTLAWIVSAVDLDHNATPNNECDDRPDMCVVEPASGCIVSCDAVEIKVNVGWTLADKGHHVTMTTFTTERSE